MCVYHVLRVKKFENNDFEMSCACCLVGQTSKFYPSIVEVARENKKYFAGFKVEVARDRQELYAEKSRL